LGYQDFFCIRVSDMLINGNALTCDEIALSNDLPNILSLLETRKSLFLKNQAQGLVCMNGRLASAYQKSVCRFEIPPRMFDVENL